MSRQSKGWASVVLLLCIVLTACSSPKPSSGRPKLIVYISGLGAKLSDRDIAQNGGYGFDRAWNTIQSYLHGTDEFANASSLTFSYFGSTGDGKPMAFTCDETFNNSLFSDVNLLKIQINGYLLKHPHTDVYLISHSLGGVVAFSFLAELVEQEHTVTLLNDGKLVGISINDSPLGGVISDSGYVGSVITKALGCNLSGEQYTSIGELRTLLDISPSADPRGGNASIVNAILHGKNIPNQQVATDAAKMGVILIVIGNDNDLLWRPEMCGIGSDFLTTEYLTEVGKQGSGAIYVRAFASGLLNCLGLINVANHVDVLHTKDVGKAIWEAFTGRTVVQLKAVTTFPKPDFGPFVGHWYAHSRAMDIQPDGRAKYRGRVFVWCTDDPRPPCDSESDIFGMNVTVVFTGVNGKTAYGIIASGTGARGFTDNSFIPVGSSITATLQPDDQGQYTLLSVSDGWLGCSPNVSTSDPHYAVDCVSGA
jgi:hypothetical protein